MSEHVPRRIQLRRTKGWRKPEGAIIVARPTKWGNPFRSEFVSLPGMNARSIVVRDFKESLLFAWYNPTAPEVDPAFRRMADQLGTLRGHDLACWCPLDQPCHADVLLELAKWRVVDRLLGFEGWRRRW